MGVLIALLLDERDRRHREEYIADHLWLIARSACQLGGGDINTPAYTDIAYPRKEDTQTAEDIKKNLVRLLEG